MSCRAEVFTRNANGEKSLAVPVQAVKYEEAKKKEDKPTSSVFVVTDGKVVKRAVETGGADDAYIEITKGLSADDEIVVGPSKTLNFLRDGERVAVTPKETPKATNGAATSAAATSK